MSGFPGVVGGICPNPQCKKKLYFPSHEASVECTGCGQRHMQSGLKNLGLTEWYGLGAIEQLLYELQKESQRTTSKDPESLKVNGLSNYLCTILSPLLTTHGMDRITGKAKLLTDMGKLPTFDCSQLGDRAFLIEPQHLLVPGYGRDRSGSSIYLKDTLDHIKLSNENEERLVPVHADGDGHCLVHAVSRALVGWELFWHPLRVNLKQHFIDNLSKYKMQFQDFIDDSEWNLIIRECDPEFVPNGAEPTGLRNIHIFGLANVLKRPIILLDSLKGIQSPGDYSAIFLPYFSPPSECMNKDGVLNKPLCIAWSSLGRNHFIPLVGVKGRKCPVLPRHMISRAWGVADSEIDKYVTFDKLGTCQIAGGKVLQPAYLQRLVAAMSDIFFKLHGASASLIADVYQHIFKTNGLMFGMNLNLLLDKTKSSTANKQLHVCLSCWSLSLAESMKEACFLPGGELYDLAVSCHGKLKDGQNYSFPLHDVIAVYSASQDKLIPSKPHRSRLRCDHCGNASLRLVQADYTIEYMNGDRTSNKSATGFKYFWNSKEYDSLPKQIPVLMEWGQRRIETKIPWFQDEEDVSLNSNVYDIAQNLVQENFPGEFGSERLVQKVVDQILRQTKKPETNKQPPSEKPNPRSSSMGDEDVDGDDDEQNAWSPHRASKAILTGLQRQSVHREELNKSATERQLRQRIESNAPKQQRKLSDQSERKHSSSLSPEPNSRTIPERQMSSPSSAVSSKFVFASGPTSPISPVPSEAASSASGDVAQDAASSSKRIRLSTSDGRNITLELPSECKFLELQTLISQAVQVPSAQQRIRHGFPPRELKPPASQAEDYKVPVQSGDKIMLDILVPQPQAAGETPSQDFGHSHTFDRNKIHSLPMRKDEPFWNSFAEGGVDEASDRVLQGLMDPIWSSGGDTLDHSLSALALTAALDNKDLWTYVQLRPHLFSVNGLFYKQVERDVGLKHGKHCQLPLLPHKVFVYNQFDDRLELCLEPYGHFPIEINIEKNVGSMLPASKCSNKSTHQPFSGQGHTLKSSPSQEDRMPTDVPMSPKRHEARRLNTLCDPAIHQESIEEELEEEEQVKEEDSAKQASHRLTPSQLTRNPTPSWGTHGSLGLLLTPADSRLVRKGPGYSELSPIPENVSNEKTEMLQQLVSRMEQACESIEQEAQDIADKLELTLSGSQTSSDKPSSDSCAISSSVAPLSCTELSSLSSSVQQSTNNSNVCDASSFIESSLTQATIGHVTLTNSTNAVTLIDNSSISLSQHESHCLRNKRMETSIAVTADSGVALSASEDSEKSPSDNDCQRINLYASSVTAGQTNSLSLATDPSQQISQTFSVSVDSSGVPEGVEAEDKTMQLQKQECQQMETESCECDQTWMEEEETNRTGETSGCLDELFIQESPTQLSVIESSSDILTSEKMDSP